MPTVSYTKVTATSDAVTVSPNKDLSKLPTMIPPWIRQPLFGQIQSYIEGNYYGFRQRFGQTSVKPRFLTKVLQRLKGQLSVVCLTVQLKTDNGEAFSILPGASFHNLGPKLVIVSVPQCVVIIFLFARFVLLLRYNFHFPEK